jgi:hypothetical protein
MAGTSKNVCRPKQQQPKLRDGALSPTRDEAKGDIIGQMLASAMGLPRICVFKVCRRNKRCFGPNLACFEHHRGLARKRMAAAIALITRRR